MPRNFELADGSFGGWAFVQEPWRHGYPWRRHSPRRSLHKWPSPRSPSCVWLRRSLRLRSCSARHDSDCIDKRSPTANLDASMEQRSSSRPNIRSEARHRCSKDLFKGCQSTNKSSLAHKKMSHFFWERSAKTKTL